MKYYHSVKIIILIAINASAIISCDKPIERKDVVALQGLRLNTLVAGKTTAFRCYMTDATFNNLSRLQGTIIRPDGSEITKSWRRSDMVDIPVSTYRASVVIRIPGIELPWIGNYQFKATAFNSSDEILSNYIIDKFELLPTKDLIIGIDRVNANDVNPGTDVEIQAARDAIDRLAGIWPVRDGISAPDIDTTAGVRFVINNAPQPYGCNDNNDPRISDCQLCPFFASWFNRPAPLDNLNFGIGFRFQDAGENVGGIAPNSCPNGQLWASIVMSGELVPGWGQETGHVFGLEPPEDPHYDPDIQGGHSKDNTIDTADAEGGFDVHSNRPFPNPTFDVMHQEVCGCPNASASYNSWDWEYLRKVFVKLPSTGPRKPKHFITSVAPAISGAGNSVYFFGKRVDGRIFYNRALLGQSGQGWQEVEGDGKTNFSPAAAAISTHIYVAITGLDGRIYLNQTDEGNSFGEWFPFEFKTDASPALAAVGNSIFVFAKGMDQRIYFTQAELGQKFSDWFEMPGNERTDVSPAVGAVANHLYVVIKKTDGSLILNQADFGHSFGDWFSMDFQTNVAPAVTGAGDHIYFFAKGMDQRIFYKSALIGSAGSGWKEVEGGGQSTTSPAGGAVGTHLFVGIISTEKYIKINQADVGKEFGLWF